jgi:hypothetical protein
VPSDLTAFSVRLPAGATEPSIDPVPARGPELNEAGESLYTLPSRELDTGEAQRVTLSYSSGDAPGADTAADEGTRGPLIFVLLVLLVVAVLALVAATRARGRRGHQER